MQFDDLKPRYDKMAAELLPVIGESGSKVLQGTIAAKAGDSAQVGEDFTPSAEFPLVQVKLSSTSEGAYEHLLLLDKSLAGNIFAWMVGGDAPEEVGDEHYDAVKEVIGQILGQVQAAFDGEEHAFTTSNVEVSEIATADDLALPEGAATAVYTFTRGDAEDEYSITHVVQGELVPAQSADDAAESGEAAEAEGAGEDAEAAEDAGKETEAAEDAGKDAEATEDAGKETAAEDSGDSEEATAEGEAGSEEKEEESGISEEFAAELAGDLLEGDDAPGTGDFDDLLSGGEMVKASPADFDEFAPSGPVAEKDRKIDMLLDVELDITVELGRKIMYVEEILRMGKGSIIELDKLAGEPVDILVNGKKLAEGEVVVIEDHFGVRLTHLVHPKERIKSLGR